MKQRVKISYIEGVAVGQGSNMMCYSLWILFMS